MELMNQFVWNIQMIQIQIQFYTKISSKLYQNIVIINVIVIIILK